VHPLAGFAKRKGCNQMSWQSPNKVQVVCGSFMIGSHPKQEEQKPYCSGDSEKHNINPARYFLSPEINPGDNSDQNSQGREYIYRPEKAELEGFRHRFVNDILLFNQRLAIKRGVVKTGFHIVGQKHVLVRSSFFIHGQAQAKVYTQVAPGLPLQVQVGQLADRVIGSDM